MSSTRKKSENVSSEELFSSLKNDGIHLTNEDIQEVKNEDSEMYLQIAGQYYKNQIYTKALAWLRRAASQNDTPAQFLIGCFYQEGLGIPIDYKEAMNWYLKAANNGNSNAQNSIGYFYCHGLGVPKDYKKAMDWYLKAAVDDKNYLAQNNIGELYLLGVGVIKDVPKAIKWFSKPAKRGVKESQYYFGWIYEKEEEWKDLQKAVNWYKMADDNGYKIVKKALKRLNDRGYFPSDDYKEEKAPQISNTVNSNKPIENVTNRDNTSINVQEQKILPSISEKEHEKIQLMEEKIKKLEEMVQSSLNLIQQDKNQNNIIQQRLNTLEKEMGEMQVKQNQKDEENKQLNETLMRDNAVLGDNNPYEICYGSTAEKSTHENDFKYDIIFGCSNESGDDDHGGTSNCQ